MTADTEDFGEPTVPACDLLRLAHSALGAPGVLDWLAGEGLVFCRSEGEYPSGKSWRFFTDDHAPDPMSSTRFRPGGPVPRVADPTDLRYRVEYQPQVGWWRWFAHGPRRSDTSPSFTWAEHGYTNTRWGAERKARQACRRRLRDLDRLGRTISKPYAPEETP